MSTSEKITTSVGWLHCSKQADFHKMLQYEMKNAFARNYSKMSKKIIITITTTVKQF